jgi:hypothetical protein
MAEGEVVNLRIERKRAKRRQAERNAAEQRFIHGQSKAQQNLARAEGDKAQVRHEQHRIETGDGQ